MSAKGGKRTLGPVRYLAAMAGHQASCSRRIVTGIANAIAVIASLAVTALVILYFAISYWGNAKTERRITGSLANYYSSAAIEVIRRQDWTFGKRDFSSGGQVCFEIDLLTASGKPNRRVAMVADDDDGGAFYFAREYDTFAQCTADFWRG